jgi:hypothetical protein
MRIDYIDKSPEILGNVLVPKMECADSYGGRIGALPGLCTWGYIAPAPEKYFETGTVGGAFPMRVHRISTFGFKHPETNFL